MSSVSSLYRRYLLVCSQWSIDTTKTGRDFGHHLRQQIPKLFPNSELTSITRNDLKVLEKSIESLERIEKNIYFRPTFTHFSASGLTADECKTLLSTQTLKHLDQTYDSSVLGRIKTTFGAIRFLRPDEDNDNTSKSESKQ